MSPLNEAARLGLERPGDENRVLEPRRLLDRGAPDRRLAHARGALQEQRSRLGAEEEPPDITDFALATNDHRVAPACDGDVDPTSTRDKRACANKHPLQWMHGDRHLHLRRADLRRGHSRAAPRGPHRGDRARRHPRARRLRRRRAPPSRLRRERSGRRPRHRRGAHGEHPAVQRGERPELGRPRPRVPAVLDPGPPEPRARGDHGRARLVHRVLPPLRLRPRRLRRALRREARAAPADPRVRARDVERPAPGADRGPARLPAPRAGPAPGLGRGRRQPAVRGPRRRARPPARAGDHRRHAGALRPGRRDPSPRGRGDGPPAPGR